MVAPLPNQARLPFGFRTQQRRFITARLRSHFLGAGFLDNFLFADYTPKSALSPPQAAFS